MSFKGAATMIIRLTRAIFSHRLTPNFKPIINEHPKVTKTTPTATHFYLFPSVYQSFFSLYGSSIGHNHSNLMPFRMALDGIKRRLFSAGLYFFFFFSIFSVVINKRREKG